MMGLFTRLLSLIYVPRCVACGVRLATDAEAPLCPLCRGEYENAKERTCAVCASRLSECLCPPPEIPCGTRRMIKLFRYRPAHPDAAESRVVFALKHRNLGPLRSFLADELCPPVLRVVGQQPDGWVIAYPPRSAAAIARDGFDHAAALAARLARRTGVRCVNALERIGVREQKRLGRAERLANAMDTYRIRPGCDLHGKRVLLLDDVITTGATVAACARLLRRAGAREVVAVTLAATLREAGMPVLAPEFTAACEKS